MNKVTPKRNHKDSIFTDLFAKDENAKTRFLSLYNALFDEKLTDTSVLEPVHLEQPFYSNFMNDVGYTIGNKVIVFIEHQSTISENIVLRFLVYFVQALKNKIGVRDWYKRSMLEIPKPEFIVLYNGKEAYPLESEIRLAEAFGKIKDEPSIELKVKVININYDAGHTILEKCPVLKDYALLIKLIVRYTKLHGDKGFDMAITESIKRKVLPGYLEIKTMEVRNMVLEEYDYATEIAVLKEEAEERGIAIGEERGIAIGEERGEQRGIAIGEKLGEERGCYQTKLETARAFKEMGLPILQIARGTGLSIEEIENL